MAFGASFLALAAWRWSRLESDRKQPCESSSSKVQVFLERHVPEANSVVILRTARALIGSTLFGLLYEGLGARFLNHNLHPDWTVFHYTTHLTLTTLFLWVGWTGLLEYWKLVPQDSIRAAVAVALFGETLLWHEHAVSKGNQVDARVHDYLALLSGLTALAIVASLMGTTEKANNPGLAFALYVSGFLGIFWQGIWFMIAAYHQKHPLSSSEKVTAIFCVSGVGLLCTLQLVSVCLCNAHRGESFEQYQLISKRSDKKTSIDEEGCSDDRGFLVG